MVDYKDYNFDFIDEDARDLGFFYIFSKYWLPVIVYAVVLIGAVAVVYWMINNLDRIQITF